MGRYGLARRAQNLRIHVELRRQDAERLDLPTLVRATHGFSGAEIEQAVVAALLGALQARVPLATDGLVAEIGSTVPLSVSRAEDVRALRESAQGRFVPVR
jgi:SpoVK/Ycf46/Vps4 family AAA+-type ATPase